MIPLFPYPHNYRGARSDGILRAQPEECTKCQVRECEGAVQQDQLHLCRYGFNYLRLSADLLVYGIVVRNLTIATSAQRRARRRYAEQTILPSSLEQLVIATARQAEDARTFADERMQEELAEQRSSDKVRQRLLKDLEPHIRSAAGQLHDYLDLSALILKQLNVFLAREYPDIEIPGGLDAAPDELQAIYWAARLMEEKIAAFGYFLEPETITASTATFRLHGTVHKYRKIYQRAYQSKSLTMALLDENYTTVAGNREALSVIPHTLLDNAIKYAPGGSRIEVGFDEDDTTVTLRVGSYGPKIEADEQVRIFEPFYRGRAAAACGQEGMGFGLAFADVIARAYGQRLRVSQDLGRKHVDDRGAEYLWTEFTCGFPRPSDSRTQSPRKHRRGRGRL